MGEKQQSRNKIQFHSQVTMKNCTGYRHCHTHLDICTLPSLTQSNSSQCIKMKVKHLNLTWQCLAMLDASMAYTRFAPAWMAKNDRIPDPAPTSKTIYIQTVHHTTAK